MILVVVAGAELFTGHNLLVMATVSRKISLAKCVRNLAIVYLANFIGATGLAALVALSGHPKIRVGAVGSAAMSMAASRCTLPFAEAFFKGILCNVLVCLAVWQAMAGRSVTGKVLAIVFPITAFVACGFEHGVANMCIIPLGIFLRAEGMSSPAVLDSLHWRGLAQNLLPVTLGNLIGGAGMVGLVYWIIYRRCSVGLKDA